MSERHPDLHELIGSEAGPEELERLERAHELLLAVGPLPELPPSLEQPPIPDEAHEASAAFASLPRRGGRILTLAAGFAALALGIGYVVGRHSHGFKEVRTVQMHGTAVAPSATGFVKVANRDSNGNFPLEVTVNGLGQLPRGSYYVLYLIKNKKPAAVCGAFLVRQGETTVRLSAPYDYHNYDGWTVAVYTMGKKPGPTLLTT